MLRQTHMLVWLVLGLTGTVYATSAIAQEVGRTVIVREAVDNDLYAAGREVEVLAGVAGDAVAAGGSVLVAGDVTEDLIAVGRSITVSGSVGDDARLAGRRVTLAGTVAGHVVAAGREVRLEVDSSIGEWAWIAGGRVEIAGEVGGDLRAAGRTLVLTGTVNGNAELAGSRVRIGDGAVIRGDLTWRGRREPSISDGAVIEGQVIEGEPLRRPGRRRGVGVLWMIYAVLTAIVAAGVFYSIFRPWCNQCAETLRAQPWASLFTGLAVLATTPLIIALLFATGIGALLGIILVLGYALALVLGGLSGVVAIARLTLGRFRREGPPKLWLSWMTIAIVVIVMGTLYVVPPLGILVEILVVVFGLGALSLDAYRSFRVSRA